MRAEYREVDWAHNSLSCEARHAMMRMIDNVGDQKEHGRAQGSNLASDMCPDFFPSNEEVAGSQQHEAGGIKKSVEVRENGIEISHW